MKEDSLDKDLFLNPNNDKIVCLNVTRSLVGTWNRTQLYQFTKRSWRLNVERAREADFVFAISNGIIQGVFKPYRWFPTTDEKYKGRWEFEGEEVYDSPFIMMSVSHFKQGSRNPVMYINM